MSEPAADSTDSADSWKLTVRDHALGLLGAVAGGLVGYALFWLLLRFGIYAMILPGALLGLGCGGLSGGRSPWLGLFCGLAALAVGVVAEWQFAPFVADRSFWFFLTHLHQLRLVAQIMIGLGSLAAFWFGQGQPGGAWPRQRRR